MATILYQSSGRIFKFSKFQILNYILVLPEVGGTCGLVASAFTTVGGASKTIHIN